MPLIFGVLKTKPCQKCGGSGTELDMFALGHELRQLRVSAGISLRGMAGRLGIVPAYLCDLEHGRRAWSTARIAQFKVLIKTKPKDT